MKQILFIKNNETYKEIIKFGIVGCIAVIVQYVTYCFCLLIFNYNIAFTIGYVVSFVVNYLLTTTFTFKTRKNLNNSIGFAIFNIINYLLQVGLLNLFINIGVSKQLSPIPVFSICVPTNFLLVRLVMKKL